MVVKHISFVSCMILYKNIITIHTIYMYNKFIKMGKPVTSMPGDMCTHRSNFYGSLPGVFVNIMFVQNLCF